MSGGEIALIVVGGWCLLSVPVAVLTGQFLRTRDDTRGDDEWAAELARINADRATDPPQGNAASL